MKLELCVCENYAPDYEAAIRAENFADVSVAPFPCFCIDRKLAKNAFELITDAKVETEKLIMCGNNCDILKHKDIGDASNQVMTTDYCFNYLANTKLIEYIVEKGGYIIANGWLKNWQANLAKQGFDRETAQRFYGDACKELVLMDTGVDEENQSRIKELSDYLEIPYQIINIGLDNLRVYLRSIVFEWRLKSKREDMAVSLQEARRQASEHSAVLNIIQQIAGYTNKRDIIGKLKEIFQILFGAQRVRYVDAAGDREYLQSHYAEFLANNQSEYLVSIEKNEIIVKIGYNNDFFGILEAGDFLFPNYLTNYANFAISIARVSGLVFENATQYELLEKSRDEITHTAIHDALTGLYNRAYTIKYFSEYKPLDTSVIYVCDIDNLKKVNDTYGHFAGDELICMAAKALEGSFRKTDIIARIGGDEFLVVVYDDTSDSSEDSIKRIADKINRINAENAGKPFQLSLSIGCVKANGANEDWEELLQQADSLMYEEKALKKRNRTDTYGTLRR